MIFDISFLYPIAQYRKIWALKFGCFLNRAYIIEDEEIPYSQATLPFGEHHMGDGSKECLLNILNEAIWEFLNFFFIMEAGRVVTWAQ